MLKTAFLDNRHKLIEESSDLALPDLLMNDQKFDLAYIDGWHTFDYTLIDIFYCVKLVKEGSFIIIDDRHVPGVDKAVKYFDTNYTSQLEIVNGPPSLRIYKKISDLDFRKWHEHVPF